MSGIVWSARRVGEDYNTLAAKRLAGFLKSALHTRIHSHRVWRRERVVFVEDEPVHASALHRCEI
eukprot:CAMPEP_0119387916 /NCGR_PEP_ID=MMETSP1334-20130426/102696_1 /TAXON_ID=127549 /ORGANISM="Calcidiscus leptoporus, Strain RCC1130" /LENGTH=64 /DNA_ID=CAMNT_0007409761 /DNA_START=198 /DNA_END=389 /DNA_ORIENTATION=-